MGDVFDAVDSPQPEQPTKDIFDALSPDPPKRDVFDAVQPYDAASPLRREPPANLDTRQIPIPGGDQPIRLTPGMDKLAPVPTGEIRQSTTPPWDRTRAYIGEKLEPITPKNPGIIRLNAADFQTGNLKPLVEQFRTGLDPVTGEANTGGAYLPPEQIGTTAKIAAGVQRGVAGVVDAAVPFIIGGTVQAGLRLPLLNRAISAGFAADMLSKTPDNVKAFATAVQNNDPQAATEAAIGSIVGGYFSFKALQHAVGPTITPKLDVNGEPLMGADGKPVMEKRGIAEESPLIKAILSRKIATEYTPEQIRGIYDKVNRGVANPAEEEFVRFINETLDAPGQALRKGVTVAEDQPRINSQFWRDYLGLKEGQKTVTLGKGARPAEAPTPGQTLQLRKQIGGPNADTEQSAVAEAGKTQTQGVPPVSGGIPGEVQKPAGAGKDIFDAIKPDAAVQTLKAEPTMDYARAVVKMTPQEFAASAKSFNNVNLALGQNATPEDAAELTKLRDLAMGRYQQALQVVQSNPSDQNMQALATLSVMPQFYNEALAEYEKKSKGGVIPNGKVEEKGQGQENVLTQPAGATAPDNLITDAEKEELTKLKAKDLSDDGLSPTETKRFFELQRKQSRSKRSATTSKEVSLLNKAGVEVPDSFLNPSPGVENHITGWTKQSEGYIQVRVESHTDASMSARLITVKAGDTLENGMDDRIPGTTRYREMNPEPKAQAKPAKQHVKIHGLDITVEHPAGSIRTGKDKGGKEWSVQMPADYGYIKRTEGNDGDQLDVYVGPQHHSSHAFVVDQINPETGKFDEHKIMLGFDTRAQAEAAYDKAFSDGSGPIRRATVTQWDVDQFKDWVKNGDVTKPIKSISSKLPSPPKGVDVSPEQWEEMTHYNDYDQVKKWGYSRAMLMEKAITGVMPAPPTPPAEKKPAGSSLRKKKPEETKEIVKGEVGGMLSSGQVVITSSGRKTTPFPEVKTDTERKTTATLKRVEEWLQRNALAEALSRGDDFNARQFASEKPGNIPPASKDAMEEYLFGEQPKVIKSPLKDLTPKLDLTVTGQAKPLPGKPSYNYVVHYTRKETAAQVGKYTVKINHATNNQVPTIYGSADSPQEAYAKAVDQLNAEPIQTTPKKERAAGDLEGLTDAELEAMLDEASGKTEKPKAPPAPKNVPAPKTEQINHDELLRRAGIRPSTVDITARASTAKEIALGKLKFVATATSNEGGFLGVDGTGDTATEAAKAAVEEFIRKTAERQRDQDKAQLEEVMKESAKEFPKSEELKRITEEHAKVKAELMGKKKKKFGGDQTKQSIGAPTDRPITQPEVEQVVRSVLGEMPANVLFVNDPQAAAGEIVMTPGRRGRVILNLARIDSTATAKDVLMEELVHGVWDSPAVASARRVIENLVTAADRQRKAEQGYDPNETAEEAANERARRIFDDAKAQSIFVRAWRAIVRAIKDLFGLNLTADEAARDAAATIIKEATRNEPSTRSGRRGSEPTPEQREAAIAEGVKEKWIPTQVMGATDFVRGREQITPLSTAESLTHAKNIFNEAGLEVARDQSVGGWRLVDRGFDQSADGRKLAEILRREIQSKNAPGKAGDLLASLLNSVVLNFKAGTMANFDRPTREALYALAQSDRSQRGLALGALAGFREDLSFVGQNMDVVLSRVYADRFGGEGLGSLMERVIRHFRSFFTDAEIEQALAAGDNAQELISRMIALNRRDEGGRVYRKVQGLLKPKNEKSLKALETDARVEEAVQAILDQAKAQGIEPKVSPNKPLSPLRKLLMMVSDKNARRIDQMIAAAVAAGERNAGIAVALKNAVDDDERTMLLQTFQNGEDPSEDDIEEGLDLPEFAHWRDIRDNLMNYSPTTLKLVQQVIKGDFKGTATAPRKIVQDSRIDLNKLAVTPDDEVRRVLDAHIANIDANVHLADASPETRQRIRQMVEDEVATQLEAARTRYRSKMFVEPRPANTPETDEQRMARQINAGLFRDERLDIPEMVARAASKSTAQRLVPKVSELVKQALDTPFYRQKDLPTQFATELIQQFGISEAQADKAADLFSAAFAQKFDTARAAAAKQARAAITPQEVAQLGTKKSLWRRIEQAVNAGIFDTGTILREIAAGEGWKLPTDAEVRQMRDWAEEEQRLRELTPAEVAQFGPDPAKLAAAQREKEAVTMERRVQIKKKMEVEWSKMVRPIATPLSASYWNNGDLRRNFAAAANEMASANLLLKIGFIPRQVMSVITQGAIHTPTRALAHAIEAHLLDRARGRPSNLWQGVQVALRDAYRARFNSVNAALFATRAAFLGRGEARNVDRLMSSIAAIERISREADLAEQKGDHGRATILRLFSFIRLGYRVAQALDNIHGVPAEYQEMIHQVERGLREQGMDRATIEASKDRVLGNMQADWLMAIDRARLVFEAAGITPTVAELQESAWNLVKRWQYDRIRELGLPADDFEENNRILRSTIGWNEREVRGLGGVVGRAIGGISQAGEAIGLPLAIGRFGNAIAIAINRQLSFTPFYKLADFGPGESGWTRTDTDRRQRKIEAAGGASGGLLLLALAWVGAIVVRTAWPKDKKERDLWEAQGIRPGTVEFHWGDGKFTPIGINNTPLQPFAPYLAAGGALHDLTVRREKAQAKLDEEAAKKGVPAGKIAPTSMADMIGVAAEAAQGSIMGGRTSAGLLSAVTDYGVPNVQKTVASQLSPLVPGLPAMQEVSRMAGVNLDANLATFWDFMLPLPTSAARKVNMFGDPAKTPDDLQRIIQVLTGGTYPGVVSPNQEEQAYATVFASGYRPPSIDPNKGYLIGNEVRPMTQQELADYTVRRGQMFKAEVEHLGPGADATAVRAAYQRANVQALSASGVTPAVTAVPAPETAKAGSSGTSGTGAVRLQTAARTPRIGGSTLRFGRTVRTRGRRTSIAKGFSKGPSLRLRRGGIRLASPKGSLRLGRTRIKRS